MRGGALESERLVLVDETGTNTSLSPVYAWSKRGKRARAKVPSNRGPNTTLVANMTAEGIGPCLAVEVVTTGVIFEAYVEKVFTPALRPGQVVVADNLVVHKGEAVLQLIEARGCKLLSLPPYSPDIIL